MKSLDEAASPPPWKFTPISEQPEEIRKLASCGVDALDEANDELTVEIRNALPELIAEIERLREENERLKGTINAAQQVATACMVTELQDALRDKHP